MSVSVDGSIPDREGRFDRSIAGGTPFPPPVTGDSRLAVIARGR